jgi:hypothetical protein
MKLCEWCLLKLENFVLFLGLIRMKILSEEVVAALNPFREHPSRHCVNGRNAHVSSCQCSKLRCLRT